MENCLWNRAHFLIVLFVARWSCHCNGFPRGWNVMSWSPFFYFFVRDYELLNQHSSCWWFEMPGRWCDVTETIEHTTKCISQHLLKNRLLTVNSIINAFCVDNGANKLLLKCVCKISITCFAICDGEVSIMTTIGFKWTIAKFTRCFNFS